MRPLPGLAPLLAPLGPAGQGSHLQREHHEGHADHDGHQQLGRPDLGRHISVAHGGEGDDAEVEGRQQGQVAARALQVLDAAGPGTGDGGGGRASAGLAPGARLGLPATAHQLSPTRRPSLGPGPALRFPTLACGAGTPSASPRAFLSCPEVPLRPLENWTGAQTQCCVGSAWAWGQRRWMGPPRLRAPTCHPPRSSSSPRRSDGAGHAQPPAQLELDSPSPAVAPWPVPTYTVARHTAVLGPSPGWTRWLRGGGRLDHPGASCPADTPPRSAGVCVCVCRGAWGRGGGRHTALGPARVLAQGTGTCGGACSPLQPPGCSQTLFSAGPRAEGPPRPPSQCPPPPRLSGPQRSRTRQLWPRNRGSELPLVLHPGFSDARAGRRGRLAGTHPVKTRHSRVQKRMRTWLNMADWVRRMARWKSFCGKWRYQGQSRDWSEPRAPPTPTPHPPPCTSQMHENE